MGNYGTIASSGGTFTVTTTEGNRPAQSPKGLIATQAVQTKKGWLGQVFVDKDIVFESNDGHDESGDAIDEANEIVIKAVKKLFRNL